MQQDRPVERARALDARCRAALRTHRLDAFDNIDVTGLLARDRFTTTDALWIGRYLMENGKALDAYRDGQAILKEAIHAG